MYFLALIWKCTREINVFTVYQKLRKLYLTTLTFFHSFLDVFFFLKRVDSGKLKCGNKGIYLNLSIKKNRGGCSPPGLVQNKIKIIRVVFFNCRVWSIAPQKICLIYLRWIRSEDPRPPRLTHRHALSARRRQTRSRASRSEVQEQTEAFQGGGWRHGPALGIHSMHVIMRRSAADETYPKRCDVTQTPLEHTRRRRLQRNVDPAQAGPSRPQPPTNRSFRIKAMRKHVIQRAARPLTAAAIDASSRVHGAGRANWTLPVGESSYWPQLMVDDGPGGHRIDSPAPVRVGCHRTAGQL